MRHVWLVLLFAAAPATAIAQGGDGDPPDAPPAYAPAAPPAREPAASPPAEASPAPPPPAAAPPPAAPAGQWVYTGQYGWLWIPYAREFTYVPGDPQVFPDQYVYYPAYGWRWVVAPWVYGYGPAPYWGVPGPRYYVWYSRPWFRVGGSWGWGGYRGWGSYRGWIGPRTWGARGWQGAPAYYRTGVGGPRAGPAFRPAPARPAERHAPRGERHEHRR